MNGRGEPREQSRELADILREAGVAATGRGGRRRRADSADGADGADSADSADSAPAAASGADTTNGRIVNSADRSRNGSRTASRNGARNGSRDRSRATESAESPWSRTDTAPVPIHEWGGESDSDPETGWSTDDAVAAAATRRADNGTTTALPKRQPGVSMSGVSIPGVFRMGGSTSTGVADRDLSYQWPVDVDDRASTSHANRSPSPMEMTPPLEEDEEQASTRGGVLGWAVLLVEVLAAIGLGIAVWYAFSALWDLLPYVAAFAGPLVVTGLVAVAGALRARTGRNPLGLPTLCILVFAGTVLVVLPAATLIVP